jgi:hypothetical protein
MTRGEEEEKERERGQEREREDATRFGVRQEERDEATRTDLLGKVDL